MGAAPKRLRWVGTFIREKREAQGLSQRDLALLFNPPVTTQFISNIERGVTPLPVAQVPTLSRALSVSDREIMMLMEKEYNLKLVERLGKQVSISPEHDLFRQIFEAYQKSDETLRREFLTLCQKMFALPVESGDGEPN